MGGGGRGGGGVLLYLHVLHTLLLICCLKMGIVGSQLAVVTGELYPSDTFELLDTQVKVAEEQALRYRWPRNRHHRCNQGGGRGGPGHPPRGPGHPPGGPGPPPCREKYQKHPPQSEKIGTVPVPKTPPPQHQTLAPPLKKFLVTPMDGTIRVRAQNLSI